MITTRTNCTAHYRTSCTAHYGLAKDTRLVTILGGFKVHPDEPKFQPSLFIHDAMIRISRDDAATLLKKIRRHGRPIQTTA